MAESRAKTFSTGFRIINRERERAKQRCRQGDDNDFIYKNKNKKSCTIVQCPNQPLIMGKTSKELKRIFSPELLGTIRKREEKGLLAFFY